MIPVIVIFIYLAVIAAHRHRRVQDGAQSNTEDFFLASRTIGPMVFFLSLFATNMTAFAILGSSGLAYRRGIGIYGLMASSSGFVIPLTIFFIGTRLWALGKRFGHQTQVQFFRDRWECDAIGTVIFALSAAMLIPYMIISIMGGGTVLQEISTAKGATDAVDSLLARLRDRRRGGDGECFLRRHARHGVGEYFSNHSVSVLRRGGGGGHQPCVCPAASAKSSPRSATIPKPASCCTRERMPHDGISGVTRSFRFPRSCFRTWPSCVFRRAR